jgi:hypothetical protein
VHQDRAPSLVYLVQRVKVAAGVGRAGCAGSWVVQDGPAVLRQLALPNLQVAVAPGGIPEVCLGKG